MQEITATSPMRLDALLASEADMSRVQVQRLIKDGAVKVNGEVVRKPAHRLREGDRVVMSHSDIAPSDADVSIESIDLKLPVLYEDDACFVINKPAGVAVHPAPGEKDNATLLHGIAYLFGERDLPFSESATLVHRLDKETTGCLLVAKTHKAHAELQAQFQDRTVKKTYLALVAGIPDPPSAVIDSPVGRKLTDRTKMSVLRTSVSRDAKTTYRTQQAFDDCALLECDLHTGRTHQIRVHLSSIGHPILGDPTYASSLSEKITVHHGIKNLCLHSWKLTFVSPADKKKKAVECEMPPPFAAAVGK